MTNDGWEEVESPKNEKTKKHKFSFEEAEASDKVIITIYGEKGAGKTCTALGLNGIKAVLCFDYKASQNKKHFFNGDPNIKVYDANKYFTKDPEQILDSAEMTYEYINFLLDEIKEKIDPDWIILDGLEIFSHISEMHMRKMSNIRPYAGIANMGVWKLRKALMDAIHTRCITIAKKGVVYTTYTDKDEIIEDGATISKKKTPKFVDSILHTTDIVIYVECITSKGEKEITAKVENSKIPTFLKTGQVINLTDRKLGDFVK